MTDTASEEGRREATARGIAGATGILTAAILASRVVGLLRNAVITHKLGQDIRADIYTGAFQIPDLLFYLIAGGALSSAFIPVFTEKITHGKDEEAWKLFSTVVCMTTVVITALILLGELFVYPLAHLSNIGFKGKELQATANLSRILLPSQIFFFVGGAFMGAQQAHRKFLIPAIGPVIYNVGIIAGGLFLTDSLGIAGFCWGALGGAAIGNFGLQLWATRRIGMRFKLSFDYKSPDAIRVWKLMGPIVFGVSLPQVSIWINRMFASTLGHGSMAAVSNANQIMQAPLGIFAQAMAVAIFPTLAAQAAQGRYADLRHSASSGIRALFFLTIPSSVFMYVLAVPIVRVLLQHGAFKPADTLLAAPILGIYSMGLFAWAAQGILARAFYAMHNSITPVVIGSLVTVLFIPLNYFCMATLHLQANGLALATSLAATLHVVVMVVVLRKRLAGFELRQIMVSTTKILLASAAAGWACWALPRALGMPVSAAAQFGFARSLALIGVSLLAGCTVYAICAVALKSPEWAQLAQLVGRRRGLQPVTPPDALPPE